ncbi:unnamed protein product, partial [Didymodactylos carnosus]
IDDEDEQEKNKAETDDYRLLSTITGQPVTDDPLIYVIPVCAPWSTLQSYKYKIKLSPGTGKKGKSVQTVLKYFMYDKTATNLEKDLIKSIKDQDISRNLPGKVKLSLPASLK